MTPQKPSPRKVEEAPKKVEKKVEEIPKKKVVKEEKKEEIKKTKQIAEEQPKKLKPIKTFVCRNELYCNKVSVSPLEITSNTRLYERVTNAKTHPRNSWRRVGLSRLSRNGRP